MFPYTKGFYSLPAFTVQRGKKTQQNQMPKDLTHTHTKFSGRKHNMDMKSSARDKVLVTPAEGVIFPLLRVSEAELHLQAIAPSY